LAGLPDMFSRRIFNSIAATLAPAKHAEKRRSSAQQEPEVVPVPRAEAIVDGLALKCVEDMRDQDDPRRQPVPDAPQQVVPPHRGLLITMTSPHFHYTPLPAPRRRSCASGTLPAARARPSRDPRRPSAPSAGSG